MTKENSSATKGLFEPKPEKYLCLLPNRLTLCWASVEDQVRGRMSLGEYWKTRDNQNLREQAEVKQNKLRYAYPKVNLWKTKGRADKAQALVAADFDELPLGYENFEDLAAKLSQEFSNSVMGRSRGGKVKQFFVVEYEHDRELTKEVALGFLKNVLGDKLFAEIDHDAVGHTLVTTSIIEAFKNVYKLKPYPLKISKPVKKFFSLEDLKAAVKERPFHRFAGNIPSKLESDFVIGKRKRNPEKKEDFIRILLASGGLLRENGFQLSTNRLSIECGVDKASVSRWINQLIKMGQLKQVSRRYFPGDEAKSYQALDELAKTVALNQKKANKRVAPEHIPDGKWREYLRNAAAYYAAHNDEAGFWREVESRPGFFDKPDRETHAKSLFRGSRKKFG